VEKVGDKLVRRWFWEEEFVLYYIEKLNDYFK
jgi:hypothetical protein